MSFYRWGSSNPKYSSLCLDQLSNLGIPITAKIELPEPDATNSTAKSIALGILSADSILPAYNLDAIFIYADRYEGFVMAVARSHLNIPICHIEVVTLLMAVHLMTILDMQLLNYPICILHLMLTLPKC